MILVTGTYPPQRCGVADYSFRLLESETAKRSNWKLLHVENTSLINLRKVINKLNSIDDINVNIQYPSINFSRKLLPHFLCLYLRCFTKKKVSVTIHEYTQLHWISKLCMFIFFWFAHKLIFTNEFERGAVIKVCSCVENKSRVIKIFSNISKSKLEKKIGERKYDIGYFGYIRHGKGIEDFLVVLEQLKKENKTLKAYILGQRLKGLEEFADSVVLKSTEIGVEVMEGRPDNEVADILSDTKVAFLPYPDGLSERRGSYLAYIRNLSLVVATDGKFVTKSQRETFKIVDVDNAAEELKKILSLSEDEQNKLQNKVELFAATEIPSSWDEVVSQYNDYLKI